MARYVYGVIDDRQQRKIYVADEAETCGDDWPKEGPHQLGSSPAAGQPPQAGASEACGPYNTEGEEPKRHFYALPQHVHQTSAPIDAAASPRWKQQPRLRHLSPSPKPLVWFKQATSSRWQHEDPAPQSSPYQPNARRPPNQQPNEHLHASKHVCGFPSIVVAKPEHRSKPRWQQWRIHLTGREAIYQCKLEFVKANIKSSWQQLKTNK